MSLMQRLSGKHGVGPVCRELDIAPPTYSGISNAGCILKNAANGKV